jgi:YebC/PmpR family DNA-binding regulatory protein
MALLFVLEFFRSNPQGNKMSGHSKWHSIKHKKAAQDAKRGKIFTKIIRELAVAARIGGGDPDANPRLRKAVSEAKAVNMPSDNIKKAIMKGTGQLEGVNYEETSYEGYGPGGVAIYVEVLSDNKNRTVSELRHVFSRNGGNIGESGCVSWMFNRKGYIVIEQSNASEDELLDIILEAGAEDLREDGSNYEIFTTPENYEAVVNALKEHNIELAASNLGYIPQNYVQLEGKQAQQLLRLMEELEDHDDVQNVWANFDIDEEEIAKYSS